MRLVISFLVIAVATAERHLHSGLVPNRHAHSTHSTPETDRHLQTTPIPADGHVHFKPVHNRHAHSTTGHHRRVHTTPAHGRHSHTTPVTPLPVHTTHAPDRGAHLTHSLHSTSVPERHGHSKPPHIAILRSHQVNAGGTGAHSSDFEAENGIRFEFSGSEGENGGSQMFGSYSYPMEDGTMATFNFVADENGYQPQSDLLPVAPAFPHPIPQFVLDQIEFARLQEERRAREGHLE